jgi:hypothetical protein
VHVLLQLLVQEVAQQRMRLKSSGGSSSGGGSKALATPSGGGAKTRTGEDQEMVSPEGSEPGSEGRVKRKKTQEEIDGFLKVRMGLQVENTKKTAGETQKTVAKDFFGREIKAKTKEVDSEAPETPEKSGGGGKAAANTSDGDKPKSKKYKKTGPAFVFKFQEGYSNAVRRTVRLADLL